MTNDSSEGKYSGKGEFYVADITGARKNKK